GDAITGSSLSVINKGTFAGGNGGAAYGYGYDGYGGNAITGDNLSIINNGAILGGNGGHWGDAINGSNMTIANSGYIISGKEDDGTQNVVGNAIHITGGNNSLILHEGSVITGDVQVNNSSILKIINNDYTGTTPTIEGDLCAGDCTTVSLSGNKFTVSGDVSFGENSSLNLAGISSLEASGNMSFGNNVKVEAIINNWAQKDYKLLSA
ncbi:TPA: autotransporter outer membrane beta-barrel domain-containing protein, partial [Shigella sonnei]